VNAGRHFRDLNIRLKNNITGDLTAVGFASLEWMKWSQERI